MIDPYNYNYKDPQGVIHKVKITGDSFTPRFKLVESNRGKTLRVHENELTCMDQPKAKDVPMNLMKDIAEFHEKFGLAYNGPPRALDAELEFFRENFIDEEAREFFEAKTEEERLDACCDLLYVVLGYCYLRGWDFNEAWRRVHAANMSKIRASTPEDSARGSVYDVIKPAGWTAPNLKDLV